jgi:hypothetical protein
VQVITWNVASGAVDKKLRLDGASEIKCLSRGGRFLLTTPADSATVLQAWDLCNGKCLTLEGHSKVVSAAAVSADGYLQA